MWGYPCGHSVVIVAPHARHLIVHHCCDIVCATAGFCRRHQVHPMRRERGVPALCNVELLLHYCATASTPPPLLHDQFPQVSPSKILKNIVHLQWRVQKQALLGQISKSSPQIAPLTTKQCQATILSGTESFASLNSCHINLNSPSKLYFIYRDHRIADYHR